MNFLVVDDHPLFAEGIQLVLESLFQSAVCQVATSAEDALVRINDTGFDLLLIDLNMPGIDGLSLLHALDERKVPTPVAVLSSVEDLLVIKQALSQGARGFIPKAFGKEALKTAIQVVLDGDIFVPETLIWQLNRIPSVTDSTNAYSEQGLSKRQLEVLVLLSKGHTNKQMATTLFVTEDTIKFHTRNLFRMLQATNRTDCVLRARQRGLLFTD